MIQTRPIWATSSDLGLETGTSAAELLLLEHKVVKATDAFWHVAHSCLDEGEADEVRFLHQSAQSDLISGCELARAGYLKQAYSLWRSWFEQTIFVLYFLEAPLHRAAWKVSGEISLDDSPRYKLMLHQLLSDSGERHPFSIVYADRHLKILEALKINAALVQKTMRPIARATKVLSTLSQGVHGTYQPHAVKSREESDKRIVKHCLPILSSASDVILQLWQILLISKIDVPPEVLLYIRDGGADSDEIVNLGGNIDWSPHVSALTPYFKEAFSPN